MSTARPSVETEADAYAAALYAITTRHPDMDVAARSQLADLVVATMTQRGLLPLDTPANALLATLKDQDMVLRVVVSGMILMRCAETDDGPLTTDHSPLSTAQPEASA